MNIRDEYIYKQAFEGQSYETIKTEVIELVKDQFARRRILFQLNEIVYSVEAYKTSSRKIIQTILFGVILASIGVIIAVVNLSSDLIPYLTIGPILFGIFIVAKGIINYAQNAKSMKSYKENVLKKLG